MRLRAAVAVSFGIVVGFLSSPAFGVSLCGVCFAIAGVSCVIKTGSHRSSLYALFFIAASVSCARYSYADRQLESASYAALGAQSFLGYVVADGEPRGIRSWYIVATHIEGVSVAVRVSLPRYPVISPGTVLDVSGDVVLAESFQTEGGMLFDYKTFLHARNIVAVVENAYINETSIVVSRTSLGFVDSVSSRVVHGTSRIESVLVSSINRILGRREGALILGMTLGRKDDLDEHDQDSFKKAGLMHIVVLSGSNVAIVVAAISSVTGRMFKGSGGMSVGVRTLVPVLGAWVLVLISGADPSARRAGFMATSSIVARTFRVGDTKSKKVDQHEQTTNVEKLFEVVAGAGAQKSLVTLVVVAAMMAWIHPHAPMFDPSYGLSFLAAFGVTFVAPLITKFLHFIPERFAIRETISQCVAAQICTFPIVSRMGSGQSWLALPVNVIAAPLVPLAMASGAAVGLTNIFSYEASILFAIVATVTTQVIYAIATFVATL